MNLLTRKTDYAIRAIVYLARSSKDVVSSAELENTLKLPRPFIRKILSLLKRKRILKSTQGAGGGFTLSLPPEKIFLVDLMKIFQVKVSLSECLFKKKICPDIKTCPLRGKIKDIEGLVNQELESVTIATLLEGT